MPKCWESVAVLWCCVDCEWCLGHLRWQRSLLLLNRRWCSFCLSFWSLRSLGSEGFLKDSLLLPKYRCELKQNISCTILFSLVSTDLNVGLNQSNCLASKETWCFILLCFFTCGGLGNLLLNHACLRAAFGVILAAGSHSRHRRMKSRKRGSSQPFKAVWSSLDPGGPRGFPRLLRPPLRTVVPSGNVVAVQYRG